MTADVPEPYDGLVTMGERIAKLEAEKAELLRVLRPFTEARVIETEEWEAAKALLARLEANDG